MKGASVVVEPALDRWVELARRRRRAIDDEALAFRGQLGLPVDRPVVMTGHQATWWHPGILAKFLAVEIACDAGEAASAWIVPDQDEASHSRLAAPVRAAQGEADAARLVKALLAVAPQPGPGVAAACVPASAPLPLRWPGEPALECVRQGAEAIVEALGATRAQANTAAEQVAEALRLLASDVVELAPPLYASRLSQTTLMQQLIERMGADPEACAVAYNEAVAAHPEAGLTLLRKRGPVWELPLWRLQRGFPRERVFADQLGTIPPAELAPRAICMTGLLRLAGCDLFVHGLGGKRYDGAAEAWIRRWLGKTLAPLAVVSATLPLPLDSDEPLREKDVQRAVQRAHAAQHNPGLVGDGTAQAHKLALVQRIRQLKEAGRHAEARDLFREMHDLLLEHRLSHAQAIAQLEAEAQRLRARFASLDVVRDRTWAFPLHPTESLQRLRRAIARGACAEVCAQ